MPRLVRRLQQASGRPDARTFLALQSGLAQLLSVRQAVAALARADPPDDQGFAAMRGEGFAAGAGGRRADGGGGTGEDEGEEREEQVAKRRRGDGGGGVRSQQQGRPGGGGALAMRPTESQRVPAAAAVAGAGRAAAGRHALQEDAAQTSSGVSLGGSAGEGEGEATVEAGRARARGGERREAAARRGPRWGDLRVCQQVRVLPQSLPSDTRCGR